DSTRKSAVLLPRGRAAGSGPNGFPVNRTAAAARIRAEQTDSKWRLALRSPFATLHLSREDLLVLRQTSAILPIACVEGWTTTQNWSGVRLNELAALVNVMEPGPVTIRSLESHGTFR